MLKNYISESSLKIAISRFIKISYWSTFIYFLLELVFSSAMIFWQPRIFFTNVELTYFIIVSFIPMVFFVFAFYVYENFYFLKSTNILIRVKSLIWILYLTIPDFILIYRFTSFIQNNKYLTVIPTVGTILFWFLGGNWDTNVAFKYIRVFKDIKYIMYSFWVKQDSAFEKNHFEDNIIKEREPLYIDKAGIEMFQKTISCPKLDAEAAFDLSLSTKLKGPVSVLDIGGGEGQFSFNLLNSYKSIPGNTITKIQYVDPVNFIAEYKSKLKTLIDESKIFEQTTNYEKWSPTHIEKYDLVIASHSLYSAIDNNKSNIELLIKKIKSNTANNGVILIVMASREGRAYSFKKYALKIIFGEDRYDVDSNLLKEHLTDSFTSKQVDNYIDLTDFIKEYDSGNPDNLKKWISYFLRVNIKSLSGQNLARVIKLLKYFVQPLHEFSNCDIDKFISANYPKPLDRNESKILSHKTEVILLYMQ